MHNFKLSQKTMVGLLFSPMSITTLCHHCMVFLPVDLLRRLTPTAALALGSCFLDQETSHLQRQRGALAAVCTPTLKSVLGQRNTKCVYQLQSKKIAYLTRVLRTLYIG